MKDKIVFTKLEDIRTLIDPYRLKILKTFNKDSGPLTAKMVADILEEVPSKVSYHIKKMEKTGILQIVDKKIINGIVAKYYAPTASEFRIETQEEEDYLNLGLDSVYLNIINDYKKSFVASANVPKNETAVVGCQVFLSEDQFSELSKIIDNKMLEYKESSEGSKSYQAFFTLHREDKISKIIKTKISKE